MSEPIDPAWARHFDTIGDELLRLTTVCGVNLREPGVVERIVKNDETVCSKKNAIGFRKLRDLVMATLQLSEQGRRSHRAGGNEDDRRRADGAARSPAGARRNERQTAHHSREQAHLNAKEKAQLKRIQKHIAPYRVTRGKDFRLKDIDPRDTGDLKSEDKGEAKEMLQRGVEWLAKEQDMLYAQDHWALLLVFQAMDAAGKDGTIKHLTSGINTQGCHVTSYKQPSSEELDHDFLWRYMRNVPARGMIGIFNRSYYEELLVVKVHPELLARQKLHPSLIKKSVWDDRYEDISNYERYLHRNGVRVVKFFLHVSHAEQSAGSWSAWTNRRRTGSSRRPTLPNANIGPTTKERTRKRSRFPASKYAPLLRGSCRQQMVHTLDHCGHCGRRHRGLQPRVSRGRADNASARGSQRELENE